MKFCYNCGAEIEEGDKFCVECGAELSLVDVEDNQSQNDEKMAKENDELLRKKQLQEEARLNEERQRQEEMRLNEERQRQEEMRLDQEKRRQEAEMREARRLEEERKQRDEDRKRLEKLDIENIEKQRIENEQRQLKKKRDRNTVAILLVLLALIAVLISVMNMNEYNKKHNDNNNTDNSEVSTTGKNNPDLTVAPINPESTKSSVTETTTQSENVNNTTEEPDGYVSNGPYTGCQFLDIEEIPKYLDGNLTTAQIGLVLDGLTSAHSKGITSREDIFSEILEQLEIYAVPGFTYKYLSKSEDVHVYDYTEYSYRDIKRLFTIILDDDEFDTFASNRNWSRYEEIIDKNSDVFRVEYFGMEVDENDWVYDSLKPMYFYIEDGKYYIEKCGTVFELYQTGNGKMKIDYSTIRKRW